LINVGAPTVLSRRILLFLIITVVVTSVFSSHFVLGDEQQVQEEAESSLLFIHPFSDNESTTTTSSITSAPNGTSSTRHHQQHPHKKNRKLVISNQIILKKKARLLTFLKNLRGRSSKRVILGQQGNHADTDLSSSYATGFDFVYHELGEFFDNERHVGYVGVDIGELGYSKPSLALQDIKFFGTKKHIVSAVFFPRNPWTGGDSWDRRQVNIADILPNGSKRAQWLSYLNTIAAVLRGASNNGIIVLIRYLNEMNGDWFWWHELTKSEFKKLYIDIHTHFTKRKGLKNLLHVYAPGNRYNSSVKPYSFYYPGAKFVDIIGLSVYEDCFQNKPFEIYEYSQILSLAGEKPLILAELGPLSEKNPFDDEGLFWYWDYAESFQKYPEVVMALVWNDWSYEGDGNWIFRSIRGNHPDGVLHHPLILAKEDLPPFLFRNAL
jgi:hypothetical protein